MQGGELRRRCKREGLLHTTFPDLKPTPDFLKDNAAPLSLTLILMEDLVTNN